MGVVLDPRTSVFGNAAQASRGRLGLLLFDDDVQRVVALTAAQIAARSHELCIEEGMIVASGSGDDFTPQQSGSVRRADTMLRTLRLRLDAKLSEIQFVDVLGSSFGAPVLARDPYRLLGEKVLVQSSSARPGVGRLFSTSARFRMPAPETGEPTVFTGALELESLDDSPLSVKGDAGCVVTSMSGEVLGILVCGIGKTSYAAPLASYVEAQLGLRVMSPSFIRNYNKEVDGRALAAAVVLPRPTAAKHFPNVSKLRAAVTSNIIKRVREAAGAISAAFF